MMKRNTHKFFKMLLPVSILGLGFALMLLFQRPIAAQVKPPIIPRIDIIGGQQSNIPPAYQLMVSRPQDTSTIKGRTVPNTTEKMREPAKYKMPTVLQRMSDAINGHNIDAFVSCFTNDFKGEQPLHPNRPFTGQVQVRENWTAMFAQVPDLRATLVASTIRGDLSGAEWHWQGTHTSGSAVNIRGVVVTGLRNGIIAWARLYMEPIHDQI